MPRSNLFSVLNSEPSLTLSVTLSKLGNVYLSKKDLDLLFETELDY